MTDLRHYDVIVSPAITEKSTLVSENNQVVFSTLRKALTLFVNRPALLRAGGIGTGLASPPS